MLDRPGTRRLLLGCLLAAAPAATCRAQPEQESSTAPHVVVDGRTDEWPAGRAIGSDGRFVYLRLPGRPGITLQGGRATTVLRLDLDGDVRTGVERDGLGVDLEILFSPPRSDADRRPRPGVALLGFDGGDATPLPHAAFGLEFAPTVAAGEYELLLRRRPDAPEPWRSRLARSSHLAGAFVAFDPESGEASVLARFDAPLPPTAEEVGPWGRVPASRRSALRVVAWNVEHAGPRGHPAPFQAVLRALDPDVVLLEEWWDTSEEELLAWFSTHLPRPRPWRAATFGDLGVAVVSTLPLRPLLEAPLRPARRVGRSPDRPVRFLPAEVEAPFGPVLVAAVHLKARGGAASWEDERRVAEAEAIHAFLAEARAKAPARPLVLAGDLNLVGSRRPLSVLADDLDADGRDLFVPDTPVPGWPSLHTWTKDEQPFTPGRLDYALVSTSRLDVVDAFALDSASLAADELQRLGLDRDASRASDHLPLVLDLSPLAPPLRPVNADTYGDLVRSRLEAGARAVVVNFWATWCVPCVRELPDLLAAREALDGEGVDWVLVSCDFADAEQEARRLLGRLGVDFPTYRRVGKDDPFLRAVHAEWDGALPATLVYDGKGRVRTCHVGRTDRQGFLRLARLGLSQEEER